MSCTVEWFAARSTAVQVVAGGTEIGADTVDENHLGITIAADAITVLEGTPDQLRAILTRALVEVDQLDRQAALAVSACRATATVSSPAEPSLLWWERADADHGVTPADEDGDNCVCGLAIAGPNATSHGV